jgi:phage terminase small subunit
MTKKQELFCEYYIESLNATDAAIKAGYSNNTAAALAHRMLKLDYILEFISKRMESKFKVIIASQDEILATLTDIMRKNAYVEISYVEKNTGELKTYKKYPTFSEVIKAAELLGKRYNMWNDKQLIEIQDHDIHVTIEGDVDNEYKAED